MTNLILFKLYLWQWCCTKTAKSNLQVIVARENISLFFLAVIANFNIKFS